MNSFVEVFKHEYFWAAFGSWIVAQFTKMICGFSKTRKFDFSYFASTGGMPSAHSAMVCGLATSIGMLDGFDTPAFMIAAAFAMITMFDASTVRRAAGQQARLLNQMVDVIFKERRFPDKKLAELLGHTRFEVFMGMIMGILIGIIVTSAPVWLQ